MRQVFQAPRFNAAPTQAPQTEGNPFGRDGGGGPTAGGNIGRFLTPSGGAQQMPAPQLSTGGGLPPMRQPMPMPQAGRGLPPMQTGGGLPAEMMRTGAPANTGPIPPSMYPAWLAAYYGRPFGGR